MGHCYEFPECRLQLCKNSCIIRCLYRDFGIVCVFAVSLVILTSICKRLLHAVNKILKYPISYHDCSVGSLTLFYKGLAYILNFIGQVS